MTILTNWREAIQMMSNGACAQRRRMRDFEIKFRLCRVAVFLLFVVVLAAELFAFYGVNISTTGAIASVCELSFKEIISGSTLRVCL